MIKTVENTRFGAQGAPTWRRAPRGEVARNLPMLFQTPTVYSRFLHDRKHQNGGTNALHFRFKTFPLAISTTTYTPGNWVISWSWKNLTGKTKNPYISSRVEGMANISKGARGAGPSRAISPFSRPLRIGTVKPVPPVPGLGRKSPARKDRAYAISYGGHDKWCIESNFTILLVLNFM